MFLGCTLSTISRAPLISSLITALTSPRPGTLDESDKIFRPYYDPQNSRHRVATGHQAPRLRETFTGDGTEGIKVYRLAPREYVMMLCFAAQAIGTFGRQDEEALSTQQDDTTWGPVEDKNARRLIAPNSVLSRIFVSDSESAGRRGWSMRIAFPSRCRHASGRPPTLHFDRLSSQLARMCGTSYTDRVSAQASLLITNRLR